MDCMGSILQVVTLLWDCTAKRAVLIHNLEENLNSLRKATVELHNISEDVKTRVELAEQQHMKRTREVDGWLKDVQLMEIEVELVLQGGLQEIQKTCFGSCCPKNCRLSYKLGKTVIKRLNDVTELKSRGRFEVVAHNLPRPPVDAMPMEKPLGLDLMYEKVRSCLKDKQVGILGLYGMGGVGKTTLLKKVNNEFLARNQDFDIAIWALVSRPASVRKVQEVILKKLQVPDGIWKDSSEEEKANEIWKILTTRKFVLMLDDVWERLDLVKVGVPLPDDSNMSKVVFTTRIENLCSQMRAQRSIKVQCLSSEEAFTLFQKEVGDDTLSSHVHIPKLAKVVAGICKGLPLALITTARAMTGMKDPSDWEEAIRELKKSPVKISGLEHELFYPLKFSYDCLRDDVTKSCFIYCSIFPEDYEIEKNELIQLWIGEGFLDEFDSIYEAHNQGQKIIRDLKHACLLERGESEERVKMHDVIRDMALWLACECGKKKNKFLVCGYDGLVEAERVAKWMEALRLLLWGSSFEQVLDTRTMSFPNLQTLFIRNCVGLKTFPTGFFQFIPRIQVLDLSGTLELTKLPLGIDKLITLQYLNLSRTSISELPMEVTNLRNLRCLLMDRMRSLTVIPPQLISNLSSLQLFSMYRGYPPNITADHNVLSDGGQMLLEELEGLASLNDLSISIFTSICVHKLKTSHKLQRSLRRIRLDDCEDLNTLELSSSSLKQMEHLEKLEIWTCRELKGIEMNVDKKRKQYVPNNGISPMVSDKDYLHNLQNVVIVRCPKLLNLSWVVLAPSLQMLYIEDCAWIEEVVSWDSGIAEVEENVGIFSRLTSLSLFNLPRLRSIYPKPLSFPSLEEMTVVACLQLRRLPFDSNTQTNSLKKIEGAQRWWNSLEWEDETINNRFTSHFSQIYDCI